VEEKCLTSIQIKRYLRKYHQIKAYKIVKIREKRGSYDITREVGTTGKGNLTDICRVVPETCRLQDKA
jgi:hypothetical protein